MSIFSFFTGRDAKEADVFADFNKIDTVVSEIQDISKTEVVDAKNAIHEALEELNNVNGLSTLVGFSVNIGAFDDVYDNVASSISEIANQLESKAKDVKDYSEASLLEKIGSTAAMALFKTGEGLLSPIEDLGDGVVSLVGFIGGAFNEDFKNACADFVKKDIAHDTFNFYYDSEFAKKSMITEDSLIANAFKVAGSTATYLYLGGLAARGGDAIASRLGSGLASAAEGSGKVAKAAQAFQKAGNAITGFASSTTYANTAVAAMTGLGSGTEAGLQSGMDYNQAFGKGAVQGAIQGTVALAAGKFSEHQQQKANIKDTEKKLSEAKERKKAAEEFKNAKTDLEEKIASRKDYNELKEELIDKGGYNDQVRKAADDIVAHMEKTMDEVAAKAPDITTMERAAEKAESTFRTFTDKVNLDANMSPTAVSDKVEQELARATSDVNNYTQLLDQVKNNLPQGYTDAITKRGYSGDSMIGIGSDMVKAATEHKLGTIAAVAINANNARVDQEGKAEEQFKKKNTISGKDLKPDDPIKSNGTGTITADEPIKNEVSKDNPTNPVNPGPTGPTNPTPSNPTPTNPTPTNPTPTDPTPTDPTPTDPTPTNPTPTDPTPTDPTPTDPTPTDPTPTDPTPTDPTPTDPTPTDPTPTETTPPNSSTTTFTTSESSGPYHSGGEYSETDGYTGENTEVGIEEEPTSIEDVLDETSTSADDIIRGNKYTKIPSSTTPITQTTTHRSTGNSIIPIAAGLSAAAAAGLGAKAYMDRKKNDEYEDDEDFETDEWEEDGDNSLEIDYNDSIEENTLDEDDDYGYQAMENEKYGARSSEELADLQ